MLSAPEIWLSTESASHPCSEPSSPRTAAPSSPRTAAPSSPRTAAPLKREYNPLFKDLSLDDDSSVAGSKEQEELSDEQAKLRQPAVEGMANTLSNKGFESPQDGGKKTTKSLSSMIRRLQVAERARQDRLQSPGAHGNARQYLSAQTVQSTSTVDGGNYSDAFVTRSNDDDTRSLPLLNNRNGSFASCNHTAAEFIPFTMTSVLDLGPYRQGAKIDMEQGWLPDCFHSLAFYFPKSLQGEPRNK